MRSDFHEVLIERPRRGMRIKTRRDGKPQVRLWDGEDGFERCVPGRPHRTKWFDDHLSPLRRWLRTQCNRPWDKVYSELCAGIDTRSVVGQHLRDHAMQEVERHCLLDTRGRPWKIHYDEYRAVEGLYVHPRTGLLRWQGKPPERAQNSHNEFPHLNSVTTDGCHIRVDGIWYRIRLRALTPEETRTHYGHEPQSLVWLKFTPLSGHLRTPLGAFHALDRYQLSSRELRANGLHNTNQ